MCSASTSDACASGLPGYVEVVPLLDDLFRAGAAVCDALCAGRSLRRRSKAGWAHNVDSASFEVERVRLPTHSPIALRRAAAGGNNQSRMRGK